MLVLFPKRVQDILRECRETTVRSLKEEQEGVLQQALRDHLIRGASLEDFRRIFPPSLVAIYESVFVDQPGWEPLYHVLKRTAHDRQIRFESLAAQSVPLEKYHVLQFVLSRLPSIFQEIADYYAGTEENLREPEATLSLLEHLRGREEAQALLQAGIWEVHFQVQTAEVQELLSRVDDIIETNYAKIIDKPEVNPSLLAYMAMNALNFRKTYLFVGLNPRQKESLLGTFVQRKSILLMKGQLLSLAKLLNDQGASWREEPLEALLERLKEPSTVERLRRTFLQDLVTAEEPVPLTMDALQKALLLFRRRCGLDQTAPGPAVEPLLADPVFRELLQEEQQGRYERFVRTEVLPLIQTQARAVHQLRRLLEDPEDDLRLLAPALDTFRSQYLSSLESEESLLAPFGEYERAILKDLEGRISGLRASFNALKPEQFAQEGIQLLSNLSDRLLLWKDFRHVLHQFGSSFLHFQRIPPAVVSYYVQLAAEYFSDRLRETTWTDLPPQADPQTLLFTALWDAREKGKLLDLDPLFDGELSFGDFQEKLFELRLSTPYRDFYAFLKPAFRKGGGLPLLKEVVACLFREDKDNSISQRILQEMSFLPDMGPEGILALLLNENFFRTSYDDLKDRIWALAQEIPERFRKVLAEKGLLEEAPGLALTPSERFFLQILEHLGLEKPRARFLEHLSVLARPLKAPEGVSRWEPMFIPHRHYLIQIEPLGEEVSISLNVSGHTEGPHPFQGRILKQRRYDPANTELPSALASFHSFIAFLRELESAVFNPSMVLARPKKAIRIRRRTGEAAIAFPMDNGRFRLHPNVRGKRPDSRLEKIWQSFLKGKGQKSESDEDMRTALEMLFPYFLGP